MGLISGLCSRVGHDEPLKQLQPAQIACLLFHACPKNAYTIRTSGGGALSEKHIQTSDMSESRSDLKTSIRQRIATDAPRKVWTPLDFADLGSRDAVDKTLQRLEKVGELRRIDRGLYDQPHHNRLTQKPSAPDARAVIDAVARRDQARMLVDGMTAANDLGFSDAVPAKIVVHTDARLKPIRLGNVMVTFRPTAASKLHWAGRPAMRIVQALHWLRDMLPREGEEQRVTRRLQQLLADADHGAAMKADLADGLSTLPTWIQVLLRPLINVDPTNGRQEETHDDRGGDLQTERPQTRKARFARSPASKRSQRKTQPSASERSNTKTGRSQ